MNCGEALADKLESINIFIVNKIFSIFLIYNTILIFLEIDSIIEISAYVYVLDSLKICLQ